MEIHGRNGRKGDRLNAMPCQAMPCHRIICWKRERWCTSGSTIPNREPLTDVDVEKGQSRPLAKDVGRVHGVLVADGEYDFLDEVREGRAQDLRPVRPAQRKHLLGQAAVGFGKVLRHLEAHGVVLYRQE